MNRAIVLAVAVLGAFSPSTVAAQFWQHNPCFGGTRGCNVQGVGSVCGIDFDLSDDCNGNPTNLGGTLEIGWIDSGNPDVEISVNGIVQARSPVRALVGDNAACLRGGQNNRVSFRMFGGGSAGSLSINWDPISFFPTTGHGFLTATFDQMVTPPSGPKRQNFLKETVVFKGEYYVDCVRQANQIVTLSSSRVPNTGGHIHPPTSASHGSFNMQAVTTDAFGHYSAIYKVGEFSGIDSVTGTTVDGNGNPVSSSEDLVIEIPNLLPYSHPDAVIMGCTTTHPDSHYLASTSIVKFDKIMAAYHNTYPNQPRLHVNDCSLADGGRFDLASTWAGRDHNWHRTGTQCDFRSTSGVNCACGGPPTGPNCDTQCISSVPGCSASWTVVPKTDCARCPSAHGPCKCPFHNTFKALVKTHKCIFFEHKAPSPPGYHITCRP